MISQIRRNPLAQNILSRNVHDHERHKLGARQWISGDQNPGISTFLYKLLIKHSDHDTQLGARQRPWPRTIYGGHTAR
jgi:hypothetical protein